MANRVFNFNPGPCTLPLDVLKTVQSELLDYRGTGMSIIESSHRSPEFDEINEQAISLTREVLGLDDKYHVMFLTGGASSQFYQIPMNFLAGGKVGAYADTGTWSTKAIKEAEIQGKTIHVVASSEDDNFSYIPEDIAFNRDATYAHITSNNTIKGTQWAAFPDTNGVPLIADMSSDIMCKSFDAEPFGLIYAGAQKNIGPAGLTVVIVREDLIGQANDKAPAMFDYKIHADNDSMYNTPPTYGWYLAGLVFKWLKEKGGLAAMGEINQRKADKLYAAIDDSDFYANPVQKDCRSWMNVPFTLVNPELDGDFLSEAATAGLVTLKGHRSVGGMRASIYNAMPEAGVDALIDFMADFEKRRG